MELVCVSARKGDEGRRKVSDRKMLSVTKSMFSKRYFVRATPGKDPP